MTSLRDVTGVDDEVRHHVAGSIVRLAIGHLGARVRYDAVLLVLKAAADIKQHTKVVEDLVITIYKIPAHATDTHVVMVVLPGHEDVAVALDRLEHAANMM